MKHRRQTSRHFNTSLGFTLPELVLIIVVLGILSAMVLPRFTGDNVFLERGYQDRVLAAVRYAQKMAVASGCEVRVCVNGGCSPAISGLQLNQRIISCTTGAFSRDVINPADGSSAYQALPPSGVALSSSQNSWVFDALGQASVAANLTIGSGSRQVNVVADTGFVYGTP